MAYPLPEGISALIHPDDEPTIAILEQLAHERASLGLPTYTRDDLDRLFQILDAPAPSDTLPANVIRFPHQRRAATARASRR